MYVQSSELAIALYIGGSVCFKYHVLALRITFENLVLIVPIDVIVYRHMPLLNPPEV